MAHSTELPGPAERLELGPSGHSGRVHVSVVGQPDDAVGVGVRGNLDSDSTPVLTTALAQVLSGRSPRVAVDLSGVELGDSTGLSAFVAGHRRAVARGGWLRLAGPTAVVGELLRPDLPVYGDVADAPADRDAY